MYMLFQIVVFVFRMQSQYSRDSFTIEKLEKSKLLMNDVHDGVTDRNIFSSYKITPGNRRDRGNTCLF